LKLSLARLDSDSVYHDRAREFNDPNFRFSESCTKKNALTKLARMSRVRHNAKSIENGHNSLNIFTKLFETFCPLHEIIEIFVKNILPTFPQNAGLFMANLGKIGRNRMDNLGEN
jgi:hypothetical protein